MTDLSVKAIRVKMADHIWRGLLVLVVLGVPASLMRANATGWQAVYVLHAFLALAAVLIFPFRLKLPVKVSSSLAVAFTFLVGAGGLWTFGFYGSGVTWMVLSSMIAAVFFSRPVSTAVMLCEISYVLAIAWGYSSGRLVLGFDSSDYIHQVEAWIGIMVGTGVGMLTLFLSLRIYNDSILGLVQAVREQRDQIAEQKALIEHQATHDALTGLPTFLLARDRLQHDLHVAARQQSKLAVLFIDLDGFKGVNDTLGHAVGDQVLRTMAHRIRDGVRAGDTAARRGGDEFVVILGQLRCPQDAAGVARKINQALSQPVDIHGQGLQLGASIGIAIYPDCAQAQEDLLHAADQAMYQVKRSGKGGFAFADADALEAS